MFNFYYYSYLKIENNSKKDKWSEAKHLLKLAWSKEEVMIIVILSQSLLLGQM